MTCRIAALGCAVLLTACAAGVPDLSDADRDRIRAEVQARVTEYTNAWTGAIDFDRGIRYFDDHPDFSLVADGGTWESLASVDSVFRSYYEGMDSQDLQINETRIAVIARNAAYVTMRGTYSVVQKDGTLVPPRAYASTDLWVNRAGEWKIRARHASHVPE